MSVILEQIDKAEQKARRLDVDVAVLARDTREATPAEMASTKEKRERREFLRESLHDVTEADRYFERILAGNELQDFNYLERGSVAGRAIARIQMRDGAGNFLGWGTGFLIAANVLLTNHHVLRTVEMARRSEAHFGFERDYVGEMSGPYVFSLAPEQLFHTSRQLDFTVVAVATTAANAPLDLSTFGCLPLVSKTGKAIEGEWLTIIQHPNGQAKQLCVRENKFIKRTENELWYTADTLAGSSGAPVFNNDWYVVALHHSGVPERKEGRIQTVDERDYDPDRDGEDQIRWAANEGIRASRIVEHLQSNLNDHPLLQPVFDASPESARIGEHAKRPYLLPPLTAKPTRHDHSPPPAHPPQPPQHQKAAAMTQYAHAAPRTVSVTLAISPDGRVSIQDSAALESALFQEKAKPAPKERLPKFDAPFDDNYTNRQGYQAGFLGANRPQVLLPRLQDALKAKAAKLLQQPAGGADTELKYHNFSVVMHAERRLAIFSAANVSAGNRFQMGRPADQWRTDPRIDASAQLGNFYYKSNKFDRGHLTRREDLEFGATPKEALQSAADTCHWSNCVPQQEKFNQGKELWQGLERYVLEEGIQQNELNIQVFTGPLFEEDDPVYERFPEIQYPVRFWKVVVAPFKEGLSATGYILDQSDAIAQYGIEATAPFGDYNAFQVPIKDIEELTQLLFEVEVNVSGNSTVARLHTYDPLEKPQPRRRPRVQLNESAVGATWPQRFRPLGSLEDTILA